MPRRARVRARTLVLAVACLVAAWLSTAYGNRSVPAPGHPLANGVALTPPMGWDSWNEFGCDIGEHRVEREAEALVSSGMRDAGYRYVIVDDCWFSPVRDGSGNLMASARFPSGMRALGDYLHARGLEFGLYESPSARTCAQLAGAYPGATGSKGHEVQDARRLAAWGVDYVKYDWCSSSGSIGDQVRAFARFRDAVAATGRPMVISINPNSAHTTTGPRRYWGDVANLWRTTQDVTTDWTTGQDSTGPIGIDDAITANLPLDLLTAPGGFNDPDMLEVGRPGLSLAEQRTQLAVWAMMAAPLIAGNDVQHQDAATTSLLVNSNLIAIDQDPLGRAAHQVIGDERSRVLVRPLSTGDVAVALLDEDGHARRLSVDASALGLHEEHLTVTDAWTGRVRSSDGTVSAEVPAHATAVFLVACPSRCGGPR